MKTYFKNKKILITGNTGFKGSWLSLWMYMYGAKILEYPQIFQLPLKF